MVKNKLRHQSGISLLEVLVSMLILGFGLLGLAPLAVNTVRTNGVSRGFTEAASLARDKLESIEGLEPLPALPHYETENLLKGMYSRQTSMLDSTTDASIPGGACKVDVAISWRDDAGMIRSTQVSTLIKKHV